MALPRVTVVTAGPLWLRINWRQFGRSPMEEAYLTTSGAFKLARLRDSLPSVVLTALKDIQTTKVCSGGFELFFEGQFPAGIYILYAGRVKLSVTDNHGRQVLLGMALPGDILGLSAVISSKCFEETAITMVPSKIGFINCRDFLGFMDHHPEAAFWVVQLLSDRVATTLEQLSCLRRSPSGIVRQ